MKGWEEPIFEGVDLPEPKKARSGGEGQRAARKVEPKAGVMWKRMTSVSKPKCGECIRLMAAGGKWKAPDPVVWERTLGTDVTYWCYYHGAEPRQKDGLVGKPKL